MQSCHRLGNERTKTAEGLTSGKANGSRRCCCGGTDGRCYCRDERHIQTSCPFSTAKFSNPKIRMSLMDDGNSTYPHRVNLSFAKLFSVPKAFPCFPADNQTDIRPMVLNMEEQPAPTRYGAPGQPPARDQLFPIKRRFGKDWQIDIKPRCRDEAAPVHRENAVFIHST